MFQKEPPKCVGGMFSSRLWKEARSKSNISHILKFDYCTKEQCFSLLFLALIQPTPEYYIKHTSLYSDLFFFPRTIT